MYSLFRADESFVITIAKEYKRTEDYIEPEDVAAYFTIFNTWPQNYKPSKKAALAYGENGRVVSTYNYGDYSGGSDYTVNIGPWTSKGVPYYEFDIGTPTTNSGYNNGSSINRGVYRVVALPQGSSSAYANEGSSDAVCFYSSDHYISFSEFYNRSGGWSEDFDGYRTGTGVRPSPITVEASK